MQKLQIGQAAIAGFKVIFGQFSSAIRIAWLPLVVLVGVSTLNILLIGIAAITAARDSKVFEMEAGPERSAMLMSIVGDLVVDYGWLVVAGGIVALAAMLMLTTNWLRHLLRGDELGDRIVLVRFGKREWKTFLAGFLLWAVMTVYSVLPLAVRLTSDNVAFFTVVWLVTFVLGIVMYFVLLRLALVFPMIALDEGIGWRTAWRMSRGNTWRLFWSFFLAYMLISVLAMVVQLPFIMMVGVASVASPDGFLFAAAIQMVAYGVIFVVMLMVMLGTLAEAYRQLNGPGTTAPEVMLAEFDD